MTRSVGVPQCQDWQRPCRQSSSANRPPRNEISFAFRVVCDCEDVDPPRQFVVGEFFNCVGFSESKFCANDWYLPPWPANSPILRRALVQRFCRPTQALFFITSFCPSVTRLRATIRRLPMVFVLEQRH